jgi:hypothetical protein
LPPLLSPYSLSEKLDSWGHIMDEIDMSKHSGSYFKTPMEFNPIGMVVNFNIAYLDAIP